MRYTNAPFSSYCSLINNIVGHEANYQAALQHILLLSGNRDVVREHRFDGTKLGTIDVIVLSGNSFPGKAAFEIKGGAYGNRNALNDTFRQDGSCADFDRLEALKPHGFEGWMIAIDAVELGRGLPHRALQGAIEIAKTKGLGFLYYAFGDDSAIMVAPNGLKSFVKVSNQPNEGIAYQLLRNQLTGRFNVTKNLVGFGRRYEKEADIVTTLYSSLLKTSCAANQVSMETYFGFAPGNGMQQRPDMCIFEPDVQGNFNLYPKGDRSKSNDAIKLKNLRCMVEVKGGMSLRRSSDSVVLSKYQADILKLQNWRTIIEKKRAAHSPNVPEVDTVFIAVDHRERGLAQTESQALVFEGSRRQVTVHYLHIPI